MTIDLSDINYLAVIVASLATFMIGGAWYTGFARIWQKAQGYSEERVKELQEQLSPVRVFGTMILCYIAISLVMAIIIQGTTSDTWQTGATLGFLIWILVSGVGLTSHVSRDVALPGYLIDTGYQLIYCVGTGVLLSVWH
jgi:hypothetical protein